LPLNLRVRVDPDQILDLPLDSARWQISGQSSQLTTGTGRQRSPYAVIQLSRSEPTFARGCQRLDNTIPIRMRHPQLRSRILVWRAASRQGITCHDFILVASVAPGNGCASPRRTAT